MNNPLLNIKSHSADVPNFYYTNRIIQHPDVSIGDYTYGVPNLWTAKSGVRITIGKFCSIGQSASITVFSEHHLDHLSMYPFASLPTDWPAVVGVAKPEFVRGDVVIGNDVWIGSNSTILGGVTIGDGAVFGAHAVVAKDVAPYSVVVGNPIREIRKRFSEENIKKLLEIKWWDWPAEKIKKNVGLLISNDIEALYAVRDISNLET